MLWLGCIAEFPRRCRVKQSNVLLKPVFVRARKKLQYKMCFVGTCVHVHICSPMLMFHSVIKHSTFEAVPNYFTDATKTGPFQQVSFAVRAPV